MPSLVQLEYVVAVADLKHFSKAAEACHISQPTLSQQIRKVEDDLDIVIFDRVKKPIVLTEEGEAILHQARLILREHKRLKELARQKSDEISGEFRLGVIPTVANTLVPHFLERFAAREGREVPSLDREAFAALLSHDYAGNIRELENLLEGAAALSQGGVVRFEDLQWLPSRTLGRVEPEGQPEGEVPNLRALQERHIRRVLKLAGGNKSRAARLLGISRRTLYRKSRVRR